jgi:hypothetical protein
MSVKSPTEFVDFLKRDYVLAGHSTVTDQEGRGGQRGDPATDEIYLLMQRS